MRRIVSIFALVSVLASGLSLDLGAEAAEQAKIRLFGYDRASGEVVLYADAPIAPNAFHLDRPYRWVVDLPNTHYSGLTQNLGTIAGTPIRNVRLSQFKSGTVRLVFDLSRKAEFPQETTLPRPGNYRLAFKVAAGQPQAQAPAPTPEPDSPEPKPTATPKPATPRPVARRSPEPRPTEPPARAAGLALHRVGDGWELTITTQHPITYALSPRTRADRVVFDLQGGGGELPKDSLYVDNGLIARVRVTPLGGRNHQVTVEFDQPIKHGLDLSEDRHVLTLSLGGAVNDKGNTASARKSETEKRITIDAGHGGMDPGTIGAHGTLEKDVTLQMALRLRKLMQDSGMEVQMTRTKDMQIMLRPRVEIGDAFDSDVFISIHANHVGDPSVSGIETYYFTPKSLPLARAVHKRLVGSLQRRDRGIRRNNFVVVKYNKMPAVLVELGYLSNPTEERLLTSPQYQQRAAEAILAGVQDYFRTRSLKQ
ncbi:N-acetylmuramoyl-L-alanine amidase LytC precursor [compost metagenome]